MKNQKQKNFKGYANSFGYPLNPYVSILILMVLLSSCKKFVQIPPPQTKLVTASVFNNNATAHAALISLYVMPTNAQQSYIIADNLGLYSDELKNYSTNSTSIQLYTDALLASASAFAYGPWTSAYNYIYQANAVIAGLKNSSGVSNIVKQQLTGEAYFWRAYWHFYLTNIYGDVPLVLTTDYNINGKISRTARVQVLQQVVTDLKMAQSLVNDNYVDVTDTATTPERVRVNKAAAEAMLARAYLYLGDYAKDASQYVNADAAASAVINNGNYSLSPLTGANSVFKANSSEAILQFQTISPTSNYATFDGKNFILRSAPSTGTVNSATVSTQLMNSFETGDQRKVSWIGTYTTTSTPAATYYFPYKYQDYYVTAASEYTMVLRLGEQYLIRAEARVHEGNNQQGAQNDLNMIRNRAGLPNYTGPTDNASLLTAILHERQVELFCEWGHRWFDLCRTGNAPAVMSVVTPTKGGVWNSSNYQLLFPIPQSDRNNDSNLSQNPGY